MAGIVDAIRERLAQVPGAFPSDLVSIERHYLIALLQLLAHTNCIERRGALELDAASYKARYAGLDLGLTKDMFLTLYAIASKPDGATYREIYDLCKGKGFIAGQDGRFEMNVRTMIKRLRQRLREEGLSEQLIENRPRIGYCWHDPAAAVAAVTVAIEALTAPDPVVASAAVSEAKGATPAMAPSAG